MSKKFILLTAVFMCAFIYGCGTKEDKTADVQQVSAENFNTNDTETDIIEINETIEIPMAEKLDWEPIVVEWNGRGGNGVEINETFEEEIN